MKEINLKNGDKIRFSHRNKFYYGEVKIFHKEKFAVPFNVKLRIPLDECICIIKVDEKF